jgi:hypothetical protein
VNNPFSRFERWKVILSSFVVSAIIGVPLIYFGKFALVLPTLMSLVVIVYVTFAKWELRRRVWFWPVIVVVVALHALAIILVPWKTTSLPSIASLPFVVADLAVVLGIMTFLDRRLDGEKSRRAHRRDVG